MDASIKLYIFRRIRLSESPIPPWEITREIAKAASD
jgi:hypothetical protein